MALFKKAELFTPCNTAHLGLGSILLLEHLQAFCAFVIIVKESPLNEGI